MFQRGKLVHPFPKFFGGQLLVELFLYKSNDGFDGIFLPGKVIAQIDDAEKIPRCAGGEIVAQIDGNGDDHWPSSFPQAHGFPNGKQQLSG